MRANNINVAARAIKAKDEGITYDQMQCDDFIEYCVNESGGKLSTSGINDMVRHHNAWLGTLQNAKAEKMLVKGAILLMWREEGPKLPAKYRSDGFGDFFHGAIYVGEKALYDTDKNGKSRLCNAMHSSETMERVAGTTTENGFTHVMLLPEIDYGMQLQTGVNLGTEIAESDAKAELIQQSQPVVYTHATVVTTNGKPANLRPQRQKGPLWWQVANGVSVLVEREKDGWSLITAQCTDGVERRAWMMSKFLVPAEGATL